MSKPRNYSGFRGEGFTYAGPIPELQGAVAVSTDDCDCAYCYRLDVFDPRRNATAFLMDGRRVLCVPFGHFQRPEVGR